MVDRKRKEREKGWQEGVGEEGRERKAEERTAKVEKKEKEGGETLSGRVAKTQLPYPGRPLPPQAGEWGQHRTHTLLSP